jgi:hypothetical protein
VDRSPRNKPAMLLVAGCRAKKQSRAKECPSPGRRMRCCRSSS